MGFNSQLSLDFLTSTNQQPTPPPQKKKETFQTNMQFWWWFKFSERNQKQVSKLCVEQGPNFCTIKFATKISHRFISSSGYEVKANSITIHSRCTNMYVCVYTSTSSDQDQRSAKCFNNPHSQVTQSKLGKRCATLTGN